MRRACCRALERLIDKIQDPREPHEYAAWELPTVFNNIVQAASVLEYNNKVRVGRINLRRAGGGGGGGVNL